MKRSSKSNSFPSILIGTLPASAPVSDFEVPVPVTAPVTAPVRPTHVVIFAPVVFVTVMREQGRRSTRDIRMLTGSYM